MEKHIKRLYKGKEVLIAGVCSGIAEYLEVDATLVRLLWLLFTLIGGSGILVYIIAWLIIPHQPKNDVNHIQADEE
jgi:phage shock protein C